MATTEPEGVRWVRFAADCAEHVLHLTGTARPEAEAAIRAAREWADEPSEQNREAAEQAAIDAEAAAVYADADFAFAGDAANTAAGAAYAAADFAYAAEHAADAAHSAYSAAGADEPDRQVARLRHYELQYPTEATP